MVALYTMMPFARPSALLAARSQLYRSSNPRSARSAIARLLSTLAVLEQRDGKLQQSSLAAIAAAQKLGGSITGFVAGSSIKGNAATEAAKIKGVEKILAVENEAYDKVFTLTDIYFSTVMKASSGDNFLGKGIESSFC